MYPDGYGVDSSFWLKILLLLVIFYVVFMVYNIFVSKLLRVKRKSFFKSEFLNEKHKKLERNINIVTVIILIIGFIINAMRGPSLSIWFLEPWYLIIFSLIAREVMRAWMEKQYSKEKNAYLLTLGQLVLAVALFLSIVSANLFKLF